MTRFRHLLLLGPLVLASMAQVRVPDPLSVAREHYNAGRLAEAIRVAQDARVTPGLEAPATVVLARAYLERYRQTLVVNDLVLGREALRAVPAGVLSPRDRVELLIAYGQSLYLDESYSLDDRFSAAAEQFEVALAHASVLDAAGRDRVFEWWASSLDRQAQQGNDTDKRPIYERILRRAEEELARDATALSASYWLAAGARGAGDLQHAVGAAVAAWVRAASLGPQGVALRSELDRLMRQVILPERARELTPQGDPRTMLSLLEAQWDDVRAKWGEGR